MQINFISEEDISQEPLHRKPLLAFFAPSSPLFSTLFEAIFTHESLTLPAPQHPLPPQTHKKEDAPHPSAEGEGCGKMNTQCFPPDSASPNVNVSRLLAN